MLTSIMIELLGTKMIYVKHQADDEYESTNAAFKEELRRVYDIINLNHTKIH